MCSRFKILIIFSLIVKTIKNSNYGYAIPVSGCIKFNFYPLKKFNVRKILFKNSRVSIVLFNENGHVINSALFACEITRSSMTICAWEYFEESGKLLIEMSNKYRKTERIINLYLGTYIF